MTVAKKDTHTHTHTHTHEHCQDEFHPTPPKKAIINIIITGQLKIVVKSGLNHRRLNSYSIHNII